MSKSILGRPPEDGKRAGKRLQQAITDTRHKAYKQRAKVLGTPMSKWMFSILDKDAGYTARD